MGIIVVAGELNPAEEVGAQETKDGNPKGKEGFAVQNMPTVSQIGHAEELQGESQFDEAQNHLYHVHPATTLWGFLQHGGEEREEREGKSQSNGETQHSDSGVED